MKTISRVMTILGVATLMGGIPSVVHAQQSPTTQSINQQSNNLAVNRFFNQVDYPQFLNEYTENMRNEPNWTFTEVIANACIKQQDNQNRSNQGNQVIVNGGYSPAGRNTPASTIIKCSNSPESLTKQLATTPSNRQIFVIRQGEMLPVNYSNYRQGDNMVQIPLFGFR